MSSNMLPDITVEKQPTDFNTVVLSTVSRVQDERASTQDITCWIEILSNYSVQDVINVMKVICKEYLHKYSIC